MPSRPPLKVVHPGLRNKNKNAFAASTVQPPRAPLDLLATVLRSQGEPAFGTPEWALPSKRRQGAMDWDGTHLGVDGGLWEEGSGWWWVQRCVHGACGTPRGQLLLQGAT